jgi:hypothetical protein
MVRFARSATLAVSLATTMAFASPAHAASAKPSATLAVATTADAGSLLPVVYKVAHLPKTAKVFLQRQAGTANQWRSLKRLSLAAPSKLAIRPKMGLYTLRVAAFSAKGKLLVSSRVRTVEVFDTVPLADLLGVTTLNGIEVAGRVFPFAVSGGNGQVMGSLKSPCRSIHLDLARTDDSYPQISEGVSIFQQSADAVSVAVGINSQTSLDATLVPGEQFQVDAGGLNEHGYIYVYINGYASCYSSASLAG